MDLNEKKYRLHTFAERGWRLAIDIALEGLRLAERGQGLAVVADETRRISAELESALDTGMDIGELLEKFTILSLNGTLEALHAQAGTGGESPMPLLLGELRSLMDGVASIFGLPSPPLAIIPEPSKEHPVLKTMLYLFHASRHGIRFAESLENIREIIRYDESSEAGTPKAINVRGDSIPVADIAGHQARPASQRQQKKSHALIVRADWAEPGRLYAVPVDPLAVNCIARCRLGASASYASAPLAAAFVRDAWDASEGQMLFPDWVAVETR